VTTGQLFGGLWSPIRHTPPPVGLHTLLLVYRAYISYSYLTFKQANNSIYN